MFENLISKVEINANALTIDEISAILSVGLSGNYSMGVSYNDDDYNVARNELTKDGASVCFEDVLAQILLDGKKLIIIDMESADDSKKGCKENAVDTVTKLVVGKHMGEDDCYYCGYELSLDDLKKSFESSESLQAVLHFINGEDDLYDGDAILQTAVFGKLVFG